MINYNLLQQTFPNITIINDKIIIENRLFDILKYLKNCPDFSFDILLTIIAIDYSEYIELIYPLKSTKTEERINISIKTDNYMQSVVDIFPSAYFDECEIYDLFGVEFSNNPDLKRLLMPTSWIGHPLKKSYIMQDERLSWNG